jgi:hypothetical protein
MMMLDFLYEHDPRGDDRADYLGGNLIWIGYTACVVQDALPADVRAAFSAGLKKQVLRINGWGPKTSMTDMDLFASVGLQYCARALKDPEVTPIVEQYVHKLFTDSRYFNPAGYFVDQGCFDTSYNGISLYFSTWATLMNDWPFTHEAIDKAYRLRAHLSFPDPNGVLSGPSAMASRCSSESPKDQWYFPPRVWGAGMLTDEALYLAPLPKETVLRGAPKTVIAKLNAQLTKPRPAAATAWHESHWSRFMNYAFEYCKKGDYEKRLKLSAEQSPLLKPLYLRDDRFIHAFDKTFLIVRFDDYAAAVHTGPVGGLDSNWHRPYGFGGGELCGFWTPAAGPVWLTRRRGIQGAVFDSFEDWRNWPVHAVTGITAAGDVVSSSRIKQPDVGYITGTDKAEVHVGGKIPKRIAANNTLADTNIQYDRRFVLDKTGVNITTSVDSTGGEPLAELYETIPVFLTEGSPKHLSTIHFQVAEKWIDGTPDPTANVTAARVTRFGASVLITFNQPVKIKLSPVEWKDGYQTQARCRTLLIDLLGEKPGALGHASVEYHISASKE